MGIQPALYLATVSLPFKMINKSNGVIFLYPHLERRRGVGRKRESVKKAYHLMMVFLSVAYSADIENETAAKHWYDVDNMQITGIPRVTE